MVRTGSDSDELKRVTGLLEVVLDGMGEGFAIYDREFRFVVLGKVEADLLREAGVDPRQVIGKVLWDVRPDLKGTVAEQQLRAAMDQRARTAHEVCFRDRWYELRAAPIRDAGISVLWHDITDRKEAERRFAASEKKFALAFDVAPYALTLVRASDGTIVETNSTFVSLFGFGREETRGRRAVDLGWYTDPADREALYAELATNGRVARRQLRVRKKTGQQCDVLLNVETLELYGERHYLGSMEDVTEQRRAEAALRDSERHFRFLADNLPQMVWTALPDGAVDYSNERWYAFTGFDRGVSLEAAWKEVLHPDDLARTAEAWARSLATGEPYQVEARYRERQTGSYRWFLVRALALRDEAGHLTRWFGTSTDIQQHRETSEQLAEALRVREDFLAVAGHELKTPLAALMMQVDGLARTFTRDPAAPRLPERLQRASSAGQRLERLIDELLDVTRISAGRLALEAGHVDLVPLVEAVVSGLAAHSAHTGVAISLQARQPTLVGQWDRIRIEQVVSNLLGNALKYGRGQPIVVEVEREAASAVVRVIDRGIGIAPDHQQRIFDRFERAVASREFGGLGLGLWISRQIVEACGGDIAVASAVGEGSTFTVRLPLQVPGVTHVVQ